MSFLKGKRISPETVPQHRRKCRFLRRIAGYVAAALIASSPMTGHISRAQSLPASQPGNAQTQPARKQKNYETLKCKEFEISDKIRKTSRQVCAIMRQANLIPSFRLKGPAKLTVRFYPAIKKKIFKAQPSVPVSINYSLSKGDKKLMIKTPEVKTKKSDFEAKEEDLDSTLALGGPIELTIQIKKGSNIFSALGPNGGFEVVNVEPVAELPKPLPSRKTKIQPGQKVVKPIAPPQKKEEYPALPRFVFNGNGMLFHEIGPGKHSGYYTRILATGGNIPLGKGITMNLGVLLSTFGLSHSHVNEKDVVYAKTDLRSLSANGAVGFVLSRGRHTALLRILGGYRAVFRGVESEKFSAQGDDRFDDFEVGGAVGYSYGNIFRAYASGGYHPFNPFSAEIRVTSPWDIVSSFGWGIKSNPWLEGDFLWLRTPSPFEEENKLGGIKLDVENFNTRLTAGLPVTIKSVTPALLCSLDLNASEDGFHYADFLLGASLSLEFRTWMLELGGALSPLHEKDVRPFFLLRAAYK